MINSYSTTSQCCTPARSSVGESGGKYWATPISCRSFSSGSRRRMQIWPPRPITKLSQDALPRACLQPGARAGLIVLVIRSLEHSHTFTLDRQRLSGLRQTSDWLAAPTRSEVYLRRIFHPYPGSWPRQSVGQGSASLNNISSFPLALQKSP